MSPICNLFDWRQFGAWMVHVINKLHIIVGLISLVLCLDDSILLKIECWWFVTSVKMSPFTLCWCWFIIIVYMGWYNDEPSNEWTHTHIHLCIWRLPAIVDLQWWLELFTTNPFQDIQETSIWGERPYKILEDTYQFPLLSMFGLPLLDQKRYKLCGVYSKVFVLLWPQRVGNNFNGPREIISRSPELVVPREQSQEPLEKCVAKHHVPEKGFVILTSRILALCRFVAPILQACCLEYFYSTIIFYWLWVGHTNPNHVHPTLRNLSIPISIAFLVWMMTTFKSRMDTNLWCHGQRFIHCSGLKHMRTILMAHTWRSRSSKVVTKNKAKNQERESTLVLKSGNQTTCSKNLLC